MTAMTALLVVWLVGMPFAYFVCLVLVKMHRMIAEEIALEVILWPVAVLIITLGFVGERIGKGCDPAATWTAERLQRRGETDAETLLRASERERR